MSTQVQRAIDLLKAAKSDPQSTNPSEVVSALGPDVLSVDDLAFVILSVAAAWGVEKPSPERLIEIAGHVESISKRGLDLAEGLRRFSARTAEKRSRLHLVKDEGQAHAVMMKELRESAETHEAAAKEQAEKARRCRDAIALIEWARK
jgi:hypothetical protein